MISDEDREKLLQVEQRSAFLLNGESAWTVVYQLSEEGAAYFSALTPMSMRDDVLATADWDLHYDHGVPGFSVSGGAEPAVTYLRFGNHDGVEPLIITQEHYGMRPEMLPQLSEEFRLYHNLWISPDGTKAVKIEDDGTEYVAAEISHGRVRIRTRLLRQFQAARQLDLVLYVDSKATVGDPDGDTDLDALREDIVNGNHHLTLAAGDQVHGPTKPFSVMFGKKLIPAPPVEKAGVWPYEDREGTYREFVIGEDEFGDPIRHTCDPDKLGNYFGKNPDAPHYLTPVFFQKDVLQKYYDNPDKYTVTDGRLRCGSLWSVQIDNDHPDQVMVFLGDLGRDLPQVERDYWASFNVVPTSGMSETAIRRSFLAQFAGPKSADLQFKRAYQQFNRKFRETTGWDLFRPPVPADEHLYKRLRLPLNTSQPEFEGQLFSLTKVLIDFLNEGEIGRQLSTKIADEKGIDKLRRWMAEQGYPHVDRDIAFLKRLQKLRSKLAAHRKGSDYEQTLLDEGVDEDPITEMTKLFDSGTAMLSDLAEHLGVPGFPLQLE